MSTPEADDCPAIGLDQLVRPTVAVGGSGRRDHARVASGIGPAWAMVGRPWVPARQGRSRARTRPLAVDRRAVGARSGMERGAGGLVLLDPLDPGSLSAVRLDQPGRLRVFTGVPRGHRAAPGTQLDRVRGRVDGTAPRCRDLSDGPVDSSGWACWSPRRSCTAATSRSSWPWPSCSASAGRRSGRSSSSRRSRPASGCCGSRCGVNGGTSASPSPRPPSWRARSALTMPLAWQQWVHVLMANAGRDGTWAAVPIALWVRLPMAVALVVWGARTDRRWTVPVASMLALPALWFGGLSMLLAVIAVGRMREPAGSAVGRADLGDDQGAIPGDPGAASLRPTSFDRRVRPPQLPSSPT